VAPGEPFSIRAVTMLRILERGWGVQSASPSYRVFDAGETSDTGREVFSRREECEEQSEYSGGTGELQRCRLREKGGEVYPMKKKREVLCQGGGGGQRAS